MSSLQHLHEVATSLLTNKEEEALELRNKLNENLNLVNDHTNGKIYKLWQEIEQIYAKNKKNNLQNIDHQDASGSNNIQSNTKRNRGRKRKYDHAKLSDIEDTQPRKKRNKSSLSTRTSTSSSISSSAKKHRRLTIRTTSNSKESNTNKHEDSDQSDDDEHFLQKILQNAETAQSLTQNNINLIEQCMNSVCSTFKTFIFDF